MTLVLAALYGTGQSKTRAACLEGCDTSFYNTYLGDDALRNYFEGGFNTAVGAFALTADDNGRLNTAVGALALQSNTEGISNTALGTQTLQDNTTSNYNTATGAFALQSNTTASSNTAVGYSSLSNNTTGESNIALGESAGINLTTGSNNIDIGNKGVAAEANTIRMGKKGTQTATYIAGIRGTTIGGGIAVLIDANGRLGTTTSSARFKSAIKPMDTASESILSLQPVTFRYKKELDPEAIPQFGLVAEEVAKVNPDLVARDDEGKPYTVRYEAVNAMLLNEFLKEHKKVEAQERKAQEQDATIRELQSGLAQQQKQIQALTAALKAHPEIHKVSDQRTAQSSARLALDQE